MREADAPRGLRSPELFETIQILICRLGAVFVHGAYEWIGVHADLIGALDRSSPVTVLAPGHATGRAYEYARDAAAALGRPGSCVSPGEALGGGSRLCGRLAALYDDAAQPGECEAGSVRLRFACALCRAST